ncbi:hypothetical protein Tco_0706384 [Tanacetum coccineum]|uniref:Uncharacterized protein n=1 Tax=Tanacetum coccineum TaxID=301880 RepID=A0ABQ4Y778_9ASTR
MSQLQHRHLRLFSVRISKGMERRLGDRGGGGGGGVVGGVGVVCGDGVDRGVGGVDCGVVCGVVYGVVCGVGFSWSHGAEGKDSFVKCDMSRNDNFVGVQVKAPISTKIVRVPEKDRWCGMRGKFVWWKGVRVVIGQAKVGEIEAGAFNMCDTAQTRLSHLMFYYMHRVFLFWVDGGLSRYL